MTKRMNPFYVIVHPQFIFETYPNHSELERIKKKEDFVELCGNPKSMRHMKNIPKNRPVLVCGAYKGWCIDLQIAALSKKGYDARVHEAGSISTRDILDISHRHKYREYYK